MLKLMLVDADFFFADFQLLGCESCRFCCCGQLFNIHPSIGSALALYVYHYLLTLGDEVELIWPSKPSALKYAFLVQRYMPFFDGSGFATSKCAITKR